MYNINCLNNIAGIGLDLFTTDYNKDDYNEEAAAVLVRRE